MAHGEADSPIFHIIFFAVSSALRANIDIRRRRVGSNLTFESLCDKRQIRSTSVAQVSESPKVLAANWPVIQRRDTSPLAKFVPNLPRARKRTCLAEKLYETQ